MRERAGRDGGVNGVGLFVAAYADERTAGNVVRVLMEANANGDFDFTEAATISLDSKGKIHIDATGERSVANSTASGGGVGTVFALLGGSATLAVGAAADSTMDADATLGGSWFDDERLRGLEGALPPGTSAVAVTTTTKFVEVVRSVAKDGKVLTLARDIAEDIRGRLEAHQDVLYTLIFSAEGITAAEMISSPSMRSMFGIIDQV